MSKIILIDPGHGGSDPGAVANGITEKDLALSMSKRIAAELAAYDCKVVLTRDDDTFVTLDNRAKQAREMRADLFLPVHLNAHDTTSARGFETFIRRSPDTASITAQKKIHDAVYAVLKGKTPDRGRKQAGFRVLTQSNGVPAVYMEYGFITNKSDAEYLRDDDTVDALCRATAGGIVDFLDLKPRSRPTTPKWRVSVDGRQVGAFLDPTRAVAEAVSSESARKIEITRI